MDFERTAEALVGGAEKAIARAIDPLLKRIEALESRPIAERGEKGDAGDRGEAGNPGRDGVGLADAMIDREGVLVLTLTSGEHRRLGMVVGKDGEPGPKGDTGERGEPGEKGEQGLQGERGSDGADGLPGEKGMDGKDGRDGLNGRDGIDGFGFDDLTVEQENERHFKLVFSKDDRRKEFAFTLPVPLDRGVFKQGETYSAGDTVTWGGSLWIAQRETDAKPDTPDSGWRLSVKRGRDGKDAK